MEIYLPIAELPVNVFTVFGMGAAVGFISGLFGVGGGFLLTPLLIFSGIPHPVAVATVTPQIVASSASGALSYWRRRLIDVKLAAFLFMAGAVGATIGAWLFAFLERLGQLDLVISLSYTVFLGSIGTLMLTEAVGAILRDRKARKSGRKPPAARRSGQHNWIHRLPFKVRFRQSRLYISVIPVFVIGGLIGFLGTLLGIGGGFIMVPALIYLLRVPTNVVIGTSLLQILGTMAIATLLHSVNTKTVDVVLALILMVGGVIGAQFGASFGLKLRGEHLRALLGLLVLGVGVRFLVNLMVEPDHLFTLTILAGGG
ncbi:sulfite exporter TauE/SafE family protein [Amorphus orientalis]|uniref:Probable membrane transporter protein n=1 Tax=Amorphus orientalis TaxID=649198 RepID=A0AAE3VQY3_9HYPH|nr:sulfite exporter TauE/SafE family protein [Amorphus orientalis]MDQ0316546.1 putative membrane protein YfcA [Amorphus orientalis]